METGLFFKVIIYRYKDQPGPKDSENRNVELGEKLGEKQVLIIELLKENPYIGAREIAKKLKISTTTVDKNIAKLKKYNLLQRKGPAKGGYWKLEEI